MTKSNQRPHVMAGLDLGTTKVTCVIGTVNPEKGIDVVGIGNAVNTGFRQGVVVNIEAASEAISKAREEAELMSGLKINSIWLGVGGTHIQSFDSQGMIAIRNKEVTSEDIERVIEAAKAVAIPHDRQVLHVLPNEFRVDGQSGIRDPIGMSGVRLECSVHIVTGSNSAIQNAYKCIEKAGLQVEGIVLQQLASALAVLSEDEKNLGVSLVDIGGGTCELITFAQGAVVHTGVIPVGGQNFTHDVAMGLKTTQVHAELLKKKFGAAIAESVVADESVEVESVGGRKPRTLARRDLCEVLEARSEETLALVRKELEAKNLLPLLGSGIVLTGGVSQLPGLVEMGDYVFDVPVRRGIPSRTGGLTDVVRLPTYATAIGLLIYGLNQQKVRVTHTMSGWTQKIKDMFA